jgi:large subunit ribosomal protein L10
LKREQKAQAVDEIADQIDAADAIYAIDYRGISVPQAAELRARLREVDASFRIVKNTLTLRAADKAKTEGAAQLKELVEEGPTALTFIKGDPASAAKALDVFAREHETLDFKGGTLGTQPLTAEDIKRLAKLPTRDALNAQLAGVVASPLTGLIRGLGSMMSGVAIALGQVLQQKDQEPQPEAAEPAEAGQEEEQEDS